MMCGDGRRFTGVIGLMRGTIAWFLRRFICISLSMLPPSLSKKNGREEHKQRNGANEDVVFFPH